MLFRSLPEGWDPSFPYFLKRKFVIPNGAGPEPAKVRQSEESADVVRMIQKVRPKSVGKETAELFHKNPSGTPPAFK